MPYTYKSLAFVWFITLGLFALTGSGVVAGPWVLLPLAVALAAPALILRSPAGASTTSDERPPIVAGEGVRSPSDFHGIDVYRWENEGGARRLHASGAIAEPAHAAP